MIVEISEGRMQSPEWYYLMIWPRMRFRISRWWQVILQLVKDR